MLYPPHGAPRSIMVFKLHDGRMISVFVCPQPAKPHGAPDPEATKSFLPTGNQLNATDRERYAND